MTSSVSLRLVDAVTDNIYVSSEGIFFALADTSKVIVGTECEATVEGNYKGKPFSVSVFGRIERRTDNDKPLFLRFSGRQESAFLALLSSGDCPLRKELSMVNGIPAKLATSNRNRALRVGTFSIIYLGLAVIVFGFLAYYVSSLLLWKHVDTAIMAAPLEVIGSPSDGILRWNAIRTGDTASAGTVIAEIVDPKLATEIGNAQLAIDEAEAKINYLVSRKITELVKVNDFSILQKLEIKQATDVVKHLTDQLHIAEQQSQRLTALSERGLSALTKTDDYRSQLAEYRKKLELALEDLGTKKDLAARMANKRAYAGRVLLGDADAVEDEIVYARDQKRIAERRLELHQFQREQSLVKAPFKAIVRQQTRSDGAFLAKGEPFLALEQAGETTVLAFVKQSDLLFINVGDLASVIVPSSNTQFRAKVTRVNPGPQLQASKLLLSSDLFGKEGESKTASLTLAAVPHEATLGTAPSGTPVVVMIERKSVRAIRSTWDGAMATIAKIKGELRPFQRGIEETTNRDATVGFADCSQQGRYVCSQ